MGIGGREKKGGGEKKKVGKRKKATIQRYFECVEKTFEFDKCGWEMGPLGFIPKLPRERGPEVGGRMGDS